MSNFSGAMLASYLSEKNERDLRKEITELAKKFENVRDYYATKLSPEDGLSDLEKYRKIIKDQFFPESGYGQVKLSIATQALNEYMKISKSPISVAELMLSYIEYGIKYLEEYGGGPENLCIRIGTLYEKVVKYTEKNKITDIFMERLDEIPEICQEFGYGLSFMVMDTYSEYFPE